jgi:hypothetical protein
MKTYSNTDISSVPDMKRGDLPTKLKVNLKQSLYKPWTGPEGSRRLRLPDFKTLSLYPEEIFLVLISVRG